MPKNEQQVRVTLRFKTNSVYLPSASLSHLTKSFGNHDSVARCEEGVHTIVTNLSESSLSLEISWAHPRAVYPSWKIQNYTQLCPVKQVTVV